jgi:hypothetical protein
MTQGPLSESAGGRWHYDYLPPNSPRLVKGGIAVSDPGSVVQRIIALQYRPDTFSRTLKVQTGDGEFSR